MPVIHPWRMRMTAVVSKYIPASLTVEDSGVVAVPGAPDLNSIVDSANV